MQGWHTAEVRVSPVPQARVLSKEDVCKSASNSGPRESEGQSEGEPGTGAAGYHSLSRGPWRRKAGEWRGEAKLALEGRTALRVVGNHTERWGPGRRSVGGGGLEPWMVIGQSERSHPLLVEQVADKEKENRKGEWSEGRRERRREGRNHGATEVRDGHLQEASGFRGLRD